MTCAMKVVLFCAGSAGGETGACSLDGTGDVSSSSLAGGGDWLSA